MSTIATPQPLGYAESVDGRVWVKWYHSCVGGRGGDVEGAW